MSDFVIDKSTVIEPQMMEMQPVERKVFTIKYFKTAIDVDGNEVQVVDDYRTEQVTVEQLESQKISLQNAIKEIDAKLAEISKL